MARGKGRRLVVVTHSNFLSVVCDALKEAKCDIDSDYEFTSVHTEYVAVSFETRWPSTRVKRTMEEAVLEYKEREKKRVAKERSAVGWF